MIRGMIKLVTHHSYSEKKPTINGQTSKQLINQMGPKSTHACPLTWGNKNMKYQEYGSCE